MGLGLGKNKMRLPSEYNIKVSSVRAKIDRRPTIIDESSNVVLKYKTPHFRASATVRFPPIPADEVWTVGWVQACTKMTFANTYGEYGTSSWEIPQLKDNLYTAISDSDGRHYPWYGATTEIFTVQGPRSKWTVGHVAMNDNFYPCVTWDVPLSNRHVPKLTRIQRDQSFNTWLVAMSNVTGQIIVLKTIQWRMRLEIKVDPKKLLGQRSTLVSDPEQEQPTVLCANVHVPPCALRAPSANNAQMLLWKPTNGSARVAIPPKCGNNNETREIKTS
ncbi:PREDICTED: protein FAM78B-like isoform X1 [Priapulus caudatus]|uniref:Protein FAM78B-like isoform X1 n=1 Tax=Priapulus caudatus TaxID=37621 RepID=A0ABM1DNW8_PRICU|nr:PREDICTED: protein FAM78B-like isoform X1 [Priapulus caudatus]XP_014661640.1 PREDICTED: protein FAM78B-like isoform X1 [Priapulus caudatus]